MTTALVMLLANAAGAQPERLLLQGYLSDANGTPVATATQLTVTFYDAATGGTVLWTETLTITPVDGLFSVVLGEDTPTDADLFAVSEEVWVGV